MGTLNVNLVGSGLTAKKNDYYAKGITQDSPSNSSYSCIDINGGMDLCHFNALALDLPNDPGHRAVYTIETDDFLPILVREPNLKKTYYWEYTYDSESETPYIYTEYSCIHDINFSNFKPIISRTGTVCCKSTQETPDIRDPENIPWKGYYGDISGNVASYYTCNKKINEANIPYIHGELVCFGTIPSSVYPTTKSMDASIDNKCLMTKQAALDLSARAARAITYNNGSMNLWGYNTEGQFAIISSALFNDSNEDTMAQAVFAQPYPNSI